MSIIFVGELLEIETIFIQADRVVELPKGASLYAMPVGSFDFDRSSGFMFKFRLRLLTDVFLAAQSMLDDGTFEPFIRVLVDLE